MGGWAAGPQCRLLVRAGHSHPKRRDRKEKRGGGEISLKENNLNPRSARASCPGRQREIGTPLPGNRRARAPHPHQPRRPPPLPGRAPTPIPLPFPVPGGRFLPPRLLPVGPAAAVRRDKTHLPRGRSNDDKRSPVLGFSSS